MILSLRSSSTHRRTGTLGDVCDFEVDELENIPDFCTSEIYSSGNLSALLEYLRMVRILPIPAAEIIRVFFLLLG